jgi:hypothetical protein
MNTERLPLLLAAILALATAAAADTALNWMTDKQLRASFAGHGSEGHYRDGRTFRESYAADKRLEYIEGGRTETGYWSIVAGTFCTIYDGIPSGGCFRVHQLSDNCFEFYFQARDERRAAEPEDRRRPSWTARAWRTDKLSTCDERPTV